MTDEALPRGTSQSSETSANSQTLDYATWLTKQQAADAIGVSTKTIEQFAKDGKIQQAVWRPQNRGAAKAVYHPDDVARIAQERKPSAAPFVLPVGVTSPVHTNGHGAGNGSTGGVPSALALPSAGPTGEDVLRLVFAMAHQALSSQKLSTSENSEKLFLTVDEAAVVSGLTPRELRAAIRDKELAARRPSQRDWRTWRIRRKDLEAL